jgi:hypothetical protein
MVGVKQPEDLPEVVGESSRSLGVCAVHRRDLTWGIAERPGERAMHRDHVSGVKEYVVVRRH